ncbi:response regulator [Pseudomonas sp. GD03842]|uniref:HDOD domain-containing protein n=1 Tax=unclassified Pseudomonas TaxID=196821 RepID=UPI000D3352FD|nr:MULTISPECIES: HDOD domain-containing protein [unclassified Pseudomonas]MDH0749428.1 response regulator [Pseudomonas sp. GD03842]RAU46051.1 response regulator [Pseudomonas sp. RIT 409]RAU53906.1 response regulator [Pseudomonas sp. RIT 412]
MTVVEAPAVPRVLIAEADPWAREMLSELVLNVRCDAQLDVCTDGKQAIELMRGYIPDLVIASRELPGVDGLSLLRGVRLLKRQPPVRFILLSNRNDSASVREAVQLAPTAYLTRPLNIDNLRQRLEHLLLKDGAQVACEVPALAPGVGLDAFLEQRRELADGGPLYVDVRDVLARSRSPAGVDLKALEHELIEDPHVTAVLIAAANSASQHQGKPQQTLGQALSVLGGVQSANLVQGLALKRGAILTDAALILQASDIWDVSRRTAGYAQILARSLELDHERCYCAGLLRGLGDLSVIRCLQEWLQGGGKLDDVTIAHALEHYAAAFGSALRTRWRLPLELRELIAAVYQYNTGVYTREVLAMNLAGQMGRLNQEDPVEALAKSKSARLLKINASDLERVRSKLVA